MLSSYLSEAGRRRVLRGAANNQGTHRFVLWLPEVWWRQPQLVEILQQYIRELFGVTPEPLADNPDQAFAQYNGQLLHGQLLQTDKPTSATTPQPDPLQVPLLAYDSGLDSLGLALLDCPDIQSAFGPGSVARDTVVSDPLDAEQVQRHRRQMLGRVGRLCSAFLVVSKLSSLHDDTLLSILETLRDTMPGVRRILCVNKVKARYTPAVVDEQSRSLVDQFQIAHVYMAYDYRSHWAEHRLPTAPPGWKADSDHPLPIFFRAVREESNSHAKPLDTDPMTLNSDLPVAGMRPPRVETYLQDLAHLLQPGSLVVESRRSVLNQLDSLAQRTVTWFEPIKPNESDNCTMHGKP